MCRKYIFCIFALVSICLFQGIILAQNSSTDGNKVISENCEEAVIAGDEDSDPGYMVDDMSYFLDHPLKLNATSAEELRQLHLLTEFQIYSLLKYITDHGELLSIYELQLVYGFDREIIGRLIPLIIVAPGKIKNGETIPMKNNLKQTVLFRYGFSGIQKAGFISDTSDTKKFEGANRAILLRYEAGISHFSFGFTSEQDAGESFASGGKHFNPDFVSGFLEYKGKGTVKKVIIGDFKDSWGQGLVLGGFGTRKGSMVLLSPQSTGLKKYSSPGENNFFRGVATSLGWHHFSLEIFASHLRIDATLRDQTGDSSAISYFSSPDISGLHRNLKEIEKKDAVACNNIGGHCQLSKGNIVLGFSYLNQQFDHEWVRNNTAYTREVFPSGMYIQNFGSDFKVSLGKIALFSELGMDTRARLAIFGGILTEVHPLVRLSLSYRNYQPNYLGLRSSGFGESSGTKNEEGFYLGLQFFPSRYFKADLYADHYSFPFLRYNSTNPYSGNEYFVNLSCYPGREFTVNMRFRYEKNQNRSSTSITGIDRMQTAQKGAYRLELDYGLSKNLGLGSRVEFSSFQTAQNLMTTGYYSSHDLNIYSSSKRYKLWIRYAMYDIPEWENRIYAYENDVLYSFTVPAFSSKGSRFIVLAKAEIVPGFDLNIRYSLSQFQGTRTRGNGSDRVSGKSDPEWTFQLRIRL